MATCAHLQELCSVCMAGSIRVSAPCTQPGTLLQGFRLPSGGGGSFPRTPGTSLPEIKAQFSGPHRLQLLVSCPHGLLHPHTTDGEAGSEKGRGVQGHPKSGTELDWNLAGHTLKQRSFASTQLGFFQLSLAASQLKGLCDFFLFWPEGCTFSENPIC